MKTESKSSRLRQDQIKYHNFLKSIGHKVYVVRTMDDIHNVINMEIYNDGI